MLPFPIEEYRERVQRTKQRMAQEEIEVLIITDPSNMNYLTGYDGWSFYVPQVVVVAQDEDEPLWIGRKMDLNGARSTTWLQPDNLYAYSDHYIHSDKRHPMDFVAHVMKERELDRWTIGLKMDSYYFSPQAYEVLRADLRHATFRDFERLVPWVRAVKSQREIHYMRQAGQICERVMQVGVDSVRPGVRQCDAVANIYHAQISGTPEFGGDYPAIAPMLPTGRHTSTPHLTWTDQPFVRDEATILEIAACRLRYHCPMARTVYLGKPPVKLRNTAEIVVEGVEAALEMMRPGVTCEEVEAAWQRTINRHGLYRNSRLGYSIGLNYPPDWGEHTMSLRPGDRTVLEPDMTFHVIAGIWQDEPGFELSESVRITDGAVEHFTHFPRQLLIHD
ncbi:MAG: M24 family metallopeptidase [Candidatus Competibacteraceae bacterium]|nr:M24 family metallopeptidase [Candidatus Competibacteraceae bacterium]